jgi:hypothetical protein
MLWAWAIVPTSPPGARGASKEEVKRIMDDASVQVDAAASIISQGNRVDIENVYTDATAKVAQKILADIVNANDAGPALAAALLTEITAFVDIPIVTGIPKQTSTPVSQGFKDAINVGLTDLTALGTYIQGSDIQTAMHFLLLWYQGTTVRCGNARCCIKGAGLRRASPRSSWSASRHPSTSKSATACACCLAIHAGRCCMRVISSSQNEAAACLYEGNLIPCYSLTRGGERVAQGISEKQLERVAPDADPDVPVHP